MSRTAAMTRIHSLTSRMHSFTTRRRTLGLFAAAVAAVAVFPGAAAAASFGLSSFSTSATSTQAGAHPDLSTTFGLNTDSIGNPVDQLKDVQVNLPAGVVGNPQAVPKCSDRDYQAFNCPNDAQVGVLRASFVTAPGASTTFVSSVPATTLTADISGCGFCNNQTMSVASTAGMASGDYLTVDTGDAAEQVVIATVDSDTQLTLAVTGNGLQQTHTAGATVADDTITVASTAGFSGTAENGENQITIGSGATAETDTVEFYPSDSTHLILTNPLTQAHAAGEPVSHPTTQVPVPIPIFNLQPDPGHVATLAGSLLIAGITIEIDVRTDGSYGLTADIRDISSLLSLGGSTLTLWGVPGDPSHDSERCGQLASDCRPSSVSRAAFMTNPTTCTSGGLTSTISVDSWQNPGQMSTRSFTQAPPSGCSKLSFAPKLTVAPDDSQADTPAGYAVNLTVPQNADPYGLATPDVQNVAVTLPAGTALSPAVANGLQGCSDAQFAAGSCPEAAKVGTVTINSPLLPDALTGSAWIGSPTPAQRFRLFMIASADNVTIKLTGAINPDANTGQITAIFANNPQLPFSALHLNLFGGPLAALANPETCGTFTTNSTISPYGSPTAASASSSSTFNITGCGGNRFAPTFAAGTQNAVAGAFSPFALTFSRSDADQELSSIRVTLPRGLLAKLAGVPLCSDAAAAAGTCGSASQVGTATVGAGAGTHPMFLSGRVYLTGPYKGGAYGLSTVIPAIAGPYDLGTVVVRQSLQIDPEDAHVTAVSDPFPRILDGVPLRLKTINLTLNRSNFIVNPTSCDPLKISGAIAAASGASAAVSSRFQVGQCSALPFLPKLGLKLSGKGKTRSGNHPQLTATLTQASKQANVESAKVTLPLSLALDPKNSNHVCAFKTAQAVHGGAAGCPKRTIVGNATAKTPLVSQPLSGKVYLVQGIRTSHGRQIKTLPTLLIPLRGQIALDLRAKTTVNGKSQLVSTFPTVPDAPISSFKLNINGGKKGILVITGRGQNICTAPQDGGAVLTAHSGKVENLEIRFGTPCGANKKAAKHSKKSRRH